MSSLAKIGPDQRVSQEFRTVGQILADQTRDLIGCWNAGSENAIVIARSSREVLETIPP